MSSPIGSCRAFLLLLLAISAPAAAVDTDRDDIRRFIDRMVEEHDYDRGTLVAALSSAETQQKIIDAISRPAEKTLNWTEYRAIVMKLERIQAGVDFWRENADEIRRISDETGVSEEMLLGIIGVETYFGRITGNYRVIDALSTLAFSYPPRSRFFTRELEEFLLLVREEGIDAAMPTGSYAGAMGRPQFMPSSYRAYAVDSTDDGQRDIWNDWSDVFGSVANYFVAHGWQPGGEIASPADLRRGFEGEIPANQLKASDTVESLRARNVVFETAMPGDHPAQLLTYELDDGEAYWVGFHNFFVITRYNRSVMYALAVHQLGQDIAREYARDSESAGP